MTIRGDRSFVTRFGESPGAGGGVNVEHMAATANASRPRRKPPEKRRDEIAAAAGRIAVTNGLAQLTAKRVADSVGVYPGLVNHYFRSSDDLAAAGFAAATQ